MSGIIGKAHVLSGTCVWCTGFVAFDTYKTLLQDEAGKISGPRTVIAGFGAGITESLLAVTPFESIKTTLSVTLPVITILGLTAIPPSIELTTASPQTRVCVAFSTALALSGKNVAFAAFSKVLYPQPPANPPIPRRDSVVTSR